MKILLLTSEFSPVNGGIATYARETALAATRLGAKVTVTAPDYGIADHAEDRRLPHVIRRFNGGRHSRRDVPAKIALVRRILSAEGYDIVHAADWPFFIPLALARRLTDARLVMTVHGTEINETQRPEKRLAIRLAGVFGARTEITANSAYTHDLFRARFKIPAERVRTVHLGVSDFWYGPRAERTKIRETLGLDPDAVTMVTVARLTRRKGHLATLAALSKLPPKFRQRLTWLVIGPDGEAEYVDALKAAVAASDCDVRLMGALPAQQIRDIYGASDFFCLTGLKDSSGRVEGFGLVYLEAAAAGLPSVATAVGGVADAVIHNETGLLVRPADDAIADAIAELTLDGIKRIALGKRAWTRARAMNWERCASATYYLHLPREIRTGPDVEDQRLRTLGGAAG
ncbi:MAG TPA: glycosyltransferase family 4 protein [Pseudolabrys sp.]|jgi:glycosyltransferase involved in cell wall biosynthesis